MGSMDRPYVGTWSLDNKGLIQHTPDALVYLNGDLSLPGCPKCKGKIEVQRFITEVSVDAGTDTASSSATVSLSIPAHHSDAVVRDARFIFRPGLEVHIYMRGYFPAQGLYSNLAEQRQVKNKDNFTTSGEVPATSYTQVNAGAGPKKADGSAYSAQDLMVHGEKLESLPASYQDNLALTSHCMETIHQHLDQLGRSGDIKDYAGGLTVKPSPNGGFDTGGHKKKSHHYTGSAVDLNATYRNSSGQRVSVPATTLWASTYKLRDTGYLPSGGVGSYWEAQLKPGKTEGSRNPSDYTVSPDTKWDGWSSIPHYDHGSNYNRDWYYYYNKAAGKKSMENGTMPSFARKALNKMPEADPSQVTRAVDQAAVQAAAIQIAQEKNKAVDAGAASAAASNPAAKLTPAILQEMNLQGYDLENLLAYPYYHVFHGVVISSNINWSGGVQNLTLQCASMMHFWQFHRMSTNASIFGARPSNSKLKTSMVGHNFTGMHPYEIIYYLHNDMVGSAGGVGWALDQKTNQDAVSSVTGESLWSLNMRYWQQRFNTSMTKLRLHGATGALFSTAQAVWLSQATSGNLTGMMKARFGKVKANSNAQAMLSQSVYLGLGNDAKGASLESLKVAGQIKEGKGNLELVLPEMQAFVSNISNWGQINLFESSYESKLDVANAVVDVTGFEFYQDVDGDFVFKPPLYNLDTSSSRVYCIEDIDIISISFDEKEPEFTYMTGKGDQFKNTVTGGTDNEWGVQGQYIDYRLVAQFGWRPGSFETAYFNDPKAIFYAAVNRMDVLNAPINSASLTIPVRPELRPGYPLYIRYLDCFYYCNSFSHSHSVGGQCNTSLELIAKRAKFFAPGSLPVIEKIDLSRPDLPAMPLEVLDDAGLPKLSGFPNVVMALDPEEVNPLFFIIGSEMERFDDERVLKKIVQIGVEQGILQVVKDGKGAIVAYKMSLGEDKKQDVYFNFSGGTLPESVEGAASSTDPSKKKTAGSATEATKINNLLALGSTRMALKAESAKKVAARQKSVGQVKGEIDGYTRQIGKINKTTGQKRIAELRARIKKAQAKLDARQSELTSVAENFSSRIGGSGSSGLAYLDLLWRKVSEKFVAARRKDGGDFGNLDSTTSLLDMLSDKKAVFTNNQLPGTYRYYSSAHPLEAQQGPLMGHFEEKTATAKGGVKGKKKAPSPQWKGKITSYLESPEITIPQGRSRKPGAALGKKKPKRGIKVLTPQSPNGEVIPTSEVREMMFAMHIVKAQAHRTSTKRTLKVGALGTPFLKALTGRSQNAVSAPQATIKKTFSLLVVADLNETTPRGVAAAKKKVAGKTDDKALSAKVGVFPKVAMPSHIMIRGVPVKTDDAVSTFMFSDQKGTVAPFIGSSVTPKKKFWELVYVAVAKSLYGQMNRNLETWTTAMVEKGLKNSQVQQAVSEFNTTLGGAFVAKIKGTATIKTTVKGDKTHSVQTPVFPVSDEFGYEVIGSYRYGRGLDIDAHGVFDTLHNQDPLSLLDKKTVDALLDLYVRGMSPEKWFKKYAGTTKTSGGANQAQSTAPEGSKAASAAEKAVLRMLQKILTDQQILNLGMAKIGDNPNMLKLNMQNYFATKGKDGVQKLPINNAAYSLADLTVHTSKRGCDCKSAEADVLLESAGQSDFVQFTAPGTSVPQGYPTGTEDRATQWLVNAAAKSSVAWRQSQDALRGTVIDRNASSVVSSLLGAQQQLADATTRSKALQKSLEDASSARLDAAVDSVETAFGADDEEES